MAPHLLGEHLQVTCVECGCSFACDTKALTSRIDLICPNCTASLGVATTGQIVKSPEYSLRPHPHTISRFDTVAFRYPDRPDYGVKRAIGLPGESIEIRGGELWINQQQYRKQPQQILAQAITVYDSRWHTAQERQQPTRLRPANGDSNWRWNGSSWETQAGHNPPESPSPTPNDTPLVYVHRAAYRQTAAARIDSTKPESVTDFLAFNQTLTEVLHDVDDIVAIWDLTSSADGLVRVGLDCAVGQCVCEVDLSSAKGIVKIAGDNTTSFAVPRTTSDEVTLAISNVDQVWTVWLGDQVVFREPIVAIDRVQFAASQPPGQAHIWIIGNRGELRLTRFRLLRDLYYRPTDRLPSGQSCKLGEDEYFLVGDNQSISVDSRHWAEPGVRQRQIIGIIDTPPPPNGPRHLNQPF